MLSCYQHGMPNQRSPITEASFFVYFGLFGHFPLYHGRGLFVNLFHPSKKSPFFMQNIPKFRRFLIVLIALNYCHSIKIKKKTPFGVFFSYLNLAFSCFFLTIQPESSILNQSASSVRKEVELVEYIISFVLSVLASVVGYYICKWFDR